ncbi:MAG: hypothetical protein H8E59_02265 [Actinobacteria bacterium]|nr:hypothetical protein [Actinomycetota bacterium]
MSDFEFLGLVISALNEAGIPHMVVGSTASSFHGEPRSTQDFDVVIDPSVEALERFVDSLAGDRIAIGDALGALEHRSLFNVIDVARGWKVDLVICKARPFSRSEFDRRTAQTIGGVSIYLATAEDTILGKLEWGMRSTSERQLRDVVGMLDVRAKDLDDAYLDHWAAELGIEEHLAEARARTVW